MSLIKRSFEELYPNRVFNYSTKITYSGKFKPYNAKAHLRSNSLHFKMSREWKEVDDNIVMGLIQVLLLRLLGGKQNTFNMKLYHSFLKKLPDVTPKKESEPFLEESFNRVNEQFFYNFMEQPTLVWGQKSTRKLGHYDLHTDTIVLSTVFKEAPPHLLDYVMYHEMLHKKHQFTTTGKHSRYHTKAFRNEEKKFGDIKQLEKELALFLRSLKKRRRFLWF